MPSLPVETVVELPMANYEMRDDRYRYVFVFGGSVSGNTADELRTKLREYLQTLVPQPKLLSECEEVPVECGVEVLT